MLIATLPSIHRTELLEKIMSNPMISGVRFNTGTKTPYSHQKTLQYLNSMAQKYRKELWIDLKGRQLRITRWSVADFGKIFLNHEVKVKLPAIVYFRGSGWATLKSAKKNVLFVDRAPELVGAGQAVNIISEKVEVKGYSTRDDIAYMKAAKQLGICNFMLSFVEGLEDIAEIENFLGAGSLTEKLNLILKIESQEGVDFVKEKGLIAPVFNESICLMAATDDLTISYAGNKFLIIPALEAIIKADKNAIFASNIFSSLKQSENLSLADVLSLKMSQQMGYRNFMFCDEVSWKCFDQAIKNWKDFQIIYGGD